MTIPIGFLIDADKGIDGFGPTPLGYRRLIVDCRMLEGHQKEAVVSDSMRDCTWRFLSDEGKHLKGADEAPFPLGFFNAGLATDILSALDPAVRESAFEGATLTNSYWMTGSFAKGDGQGYADPAVVQVSAKQGHSSQELAQQLEHASKNSYAVDALSREVETSFSLIVNGKRIALSQLTGSEREVADPFTKYQNAPEPQAGVAYPEVIRKTTVVEKGDIKPAQVGSSTRIVRQVIGRIRLDGLTLSADTWLELPGMSHFELDSSLGDDANNRLLPSGVAYLASGVAFCFMTQLSRYIEHMKFKVGGLRLTQIWDMPVLSDGDDQASMPSQMETHLFMNSKDQDVRCEQLMTVAVQTCYLHATLKSRLPPVFEAMSS